MQWSYGVSISHEVQTAAEIVRKVHQASSRFDIPDIGVQAKVIGSPKATGNRIEATIPARENFLVRSDGKMRRNISKKQSLLNAEETK